MAHLWSAEQVLDIHPDGFILTCSGTKKKGVPCQNRISTADRQLARNFLDTLSMLDDVTLGADGNIVAQLVRNLVLCTLCKGVHRKVESQVAVDTEKFRQRVLRFVAERQNMAIAQQGPVAVRQPASAQPAVNASQTQPRPVQQQAERQNGTQLAAANADNQARARVSTRARPPPPLQALDPTSVDGPQADRERRYEAAANRLHRSNQHQVLNIETSNLILARHLAQEPRVQNSQVAQQEREDFEVAQRLALEDMENLTGTRPLRSRLSALTRRRHPSQSSSVAQALPPQLPPLPRLPQLPQSFQPYQRPHFQQEQPARMDNAQGPGPSRNPAQVQDLLSQPTAVPNSIPVPRSVQGSPMAPPMILAQTRRVRVPRFREEDGSRMTSAQRAGGAVPESDVPSSSSPTPTQRFSSPLWQQQPPIVPNFDAPEPQLEQRPTFQQRLNRMAHVNNAAAPSSAQNDASPSPSSTSRPRSAGLDLTNFATATQQRPMSQPLRRENGETALRSPRVRRDLQQDPFLSPWPRDLQRPVEQRGRDTEPGLLNDLSQALNEVRIAAEQGLISPVESDLPRRETPSIGLEPNHRERFWNRPAPRPYSSHSGPHGDILPTGFTSRAAHEGGTSSPAQAPERLFYPHASRPNGTYLAPYTYIYSPHRRYSPPPFSRRNAVSNPSAARRASLTENCYICYEGFDAEGGDAVWCKGQCGKNVHRACFEEWRVRRLTTGPVTCPHCRSDWVSDFPHQQAVQSWL